MRASSVEMLGDATWYMPTVIPAAIAPDAFVTKAGSTCLRPSVALTTAKPTPLFVTEDQFTGADP